MKVRIETASVAAFCAGPDMSIYYASKAFVRSFSEAVAEGGEGDRCDSDCNLPQTHGDWI